MSEAPNFNEMLRGMLPQDRAKLALEAALIAVPPAPVLECVVTILNRRRLDPSVVSAWSRNAPSWAQQAYERDPEQTARMIESY